MVKDIASECGNEFSARFAGVRGRRKTNNEIDHKFRDMHIE
jgi:hypothetical protein